MLGDWSRGESILLSQLSITSCIPGMMSSSGCSWELLSFEKFFIMMHISESCMHLLSLIISEHSGGRDGVSFTRFSIDHWCLKIQFLRCTPQMSHFITDVTDTSAFEVGSQIQGAV